MNDKIISALSVIGGVIVGAILTFLSQWFIAIRQRSWDIDNQMRQKRYERLKDRTNVLTQQIGLKMTLLLNMGNHMFDEQEMNNEEHKRIDNKIDAREGEVHSALMALGSEKLHKMYLEFNTYYHNTNSNQEYKELQRAWGIAESMHQEMEWLLDEALVKNTKTKN
jgi:hypothetical protein